MCLGQRELRHGTALTTGWAMLDIAMLLLGMNWRPGWCLGWFWKAVLIVVYSVATYYSVGIM